MNRKGFTLVELLVVIVIIGLVIGLSTFGIIKAYNNSKEKTLAISKENVLKAAKIYSEEKSDDQTRWTNITTTGDTYTYFCMSVKELINNGLLEESKVSNYVNDYVYIKKNRLTYTIDDSEIVKRENLSDNEEASKACRDIVSLDSEAPVIGDHSSYTDEIDITYTDVGVQEEMKKTECVYNIENDSMILSTEATEDKRCELENLKSDTDYVVKVCASTDSEYICSESATIRTLDIIAPTITLTDRINITYDDTNIKSEASHYFKSSLEGTSSKEVHPCTLKNNVFTCEEIVTTKIEHNTWYQVDDNTIDIIYENKDGGSGKVTARTTDESNNYKESEKDFSVYATTFKKGNADTIDNVTSDIIRFCLAEAKGECNIVSPSINKVGYTALGWSTNENATTANWAGNTEKSVSQSNVYYPIFKVNKVIVKHNAQGGTIRESEVYSGVRYYWKLTDDIVERSKDNETFTDSFYKYNYGKTISSSGLTDYNSSTYMYISKDGYIGEKNNEWKCISGCKQDYYDQKTVYNTSDLCDASLSDCTIEIGVNWVPITYSVKYNNVCSLTKSGTMSNSSHTYDVSKNLTANAYSCSSVVTFEYNGATGGNSTNSLTATSTFKGWSKTSGGSKNYNNSASVKNLTTTNNGTVNLYTVWTSGSINLPSPTKSGYFFDGWYSDSSLTTRVGGEGDNYTPTKGTVTLYAKWTNNMDKPTAANFCKSNLVYSGEEQTLTKTPGAGYTFSNNKRTNAGSQTVTATLKDGYRWSDNTTANVTFSCSIEKATPTITLNKTSGKTIADKTLTFTEKADVAGTFTNSSSSESIATISPKTNSSVAANTAKTETITGVANGTATITVNFTPTDTTNYNNAPAKTYTATILKSATKPTAANYCKTGLVYNTEEQTLTKTAGTGYTFSNNKRTNAGSQTVTATLKDGYRWSDNTTANVTFSCSIAKADTTITLNKTSGTTAVGNTAKFTEKANVDGTFTNSSSSESIATISPKTNSSVAANTAKTETITGVANGTATITVNFTPTDTTNYNNAPAKTYTATILKSATKPTATSYCKTNLVYNMEEQTLTKTAGTGYTFSNNKRTNAGSQTVTATLKDGYRWSDNSTDDITFSCSIAKANTTITLSSTKGTTVVGKTLEFNEKANVKGKFTITTSSSSIATASQASSSAIAANTNNKVTVTAVGSGSATITVNFTPTDTTNYNNAPAKTYTATILKSATKPTAANYCKTDLVYNTEEQTLTKTAGTGYTFSNNKRTNAGSQAVTATLKDGYRWSDNTTADVTFSCSIAKANTTITLSPSSGTTVVGKTLEFNEKANVKGKFTITTSSSSIATASQASSSEIAANTNNKVTVTGVADGSATITVNFTPTDTTNYNNATAKTYTATILKSATKPTAANYCKTGLVYNTEEQTLTKTAGTGYTFSNNKRTNAGSQTVTATLKDGYRWSDNTTADVTFSCSIAKANTTITLSPSSGTTVVGKTLEFNEKANVKGKFTITTSSSSIATASQASSSEIAANTNNKVTVTGVSYGAATITVNFTPTDTTNYNNATAKTYTATILKSATKPTAANYCKTDLVYNMEEQTLTKTAGTGYTFSNNKRTNAGSQAVTATLKDGYRWSDNSTDDITFSCSIAKANTTITLSPTSGTTVVGKTLEFNEKANVKGKFNIATSSSLIATASQASSSEIAANTNNKVTVTGVSNGTATITVNFTPTDTTNYNNATAKTYTATILKSATKPTAANYCKTGLVYNTEEQTLTKTAGTGYTFSNNKRTNAGSQTVTATLKDGYRWSDNTTANVTFSCSIAKAEMTVTSANYSKNYDNSSHGITLNVTTPTSGTTKYYSTTTNLTSSNYSSSGSTTAPTRSAYGTTTVYWYVHSTNGNYNDKSGTNTIQIKDSTPPKLYISIYDNGTNKKNCDSTAGTTVCEVTSSISTNNSIKIYVKDNLNDDNPFNGSDVNTTATRKYNAGGNMTSYSETISGTNDFTLTYNSEAKNYQATTSISSAGYRVIWIAAKDKAGNETTMKIKLPVGICSTSNPSGCSSKYFCKTSQTMVHEAAYAPSGVSQQVTENGVTYTNQYWTAKSGSSVHVLSTVTNNNGTAFYLVCFDDANYSSSIYDNNAYYYGPYAKNSNGYFFTSNRISFSGINSAKQCGYVYNKCLASSPPTSSSNCNNDCLG